MPLHEFAEQAWALIEPGQRFVRCWHLRAEADHLEALTRGQIDNLLISAPPSTGKSILTCVIWPAWAWTENPGFRFLFGTYSKDYSLRDSVRCRDLIQSAWYRQRWGQTVVLCEDQNQKTRYSTTHGGWRLATSVGGLGTGEHPDFIGIDDPLNAIEADSAAAKAEVLAWRGGTLATRGMARRCKTVCIAQRLAEDDLPGHILEHEGEDWEKLILPMEFEPGRMGPTSLGFTDPRQEPGELLCPELLPREVIESRKRKMTPRQVAAQFQQRPVPEGGAIFREDWLRFYRVDGEYVWFRKADGQRVALALSQIRTFIIIDLAASTKTSADHTNICVWGDSGYGDIILLECHEERMEFPDVLPKAAYLKGKWHAQYIGIESYGFQLSAVQAARRVGLPVKELKHRVPQSDKVAHSIAAQVKMAAGQIWFPEPEIHAWVRPLIDQVLHFRPGSKRDDFVDNLSYAAEEFSDLYDRGKSRPPMALGPGLPGTPYSG